MRSLSPPSVRSVVSTVGLLLLAGLALAIIGAVSVFQTLTGTEDYGPSKSGHSTPGSGPTAKRGGVSDQRESHEPQYHRRTTVLRATAFVLVAAVFAVLAYEVFARAVVANLPAYETTPAHRYTVPLVIAIALSILLERSPAIARFIVGLLFGRRIEPIHKEDLTTALCWMTAWGLTVMSLLGLLDYGLSKFGYDILLKTVAGLSAEEVTPATAVVVGVMASLFVSSFSMLIGEYRFQLNGGE